MPRWAARAHVLIAWQHKGSATISVSKTKRPRAAPTQRTLVKRRGGQQRRQQRVAIVSQDALHGALMNADPLSRGRGGPAVAW